MAPKVAMSVSNNSASMRKRIYWRTPAGMEHGFVTKEDGSRFEVYSYSTGEVIRVMQKDVAKVINEDL